MQVKSDRIKLFISTAGGLGLSPYFPGSCGALLGVVLHLLIAYFIGSRYQSLLLVAAFLTVSCAHYLLNTWAEAFWKEKDPKHFVLDEVAGYLIVPIFFDRGDPWRIALWGYLLFRALDIIKLPPARQIDRQMKNATGVILDDVVSGFYAVILMYIGNYLFS